MNPICYICGKEVSRDRRVTTWLDDFGEIWTSAHHECSLAAWKLAKTARENPNAKTDEELKEAIATELECCIAIVEPYKGDTAESIWDELVARRMDLDG